MSLNREYSVVWKFFEKKDDNEVQCKICQKRLKFVSPTSSMISHLRSLHSRELKDIENEVANQNHSGSISNESNSLALEANDALVLMLSTSNVPFRIVKNPWFVRFCHSLNSEFKPISVDGIRRKLLANEEEYLKKTKKTLLEMEKCFISFDGWDGNYETVNLYALFLYFIDSKFNRKRIFLGIRNLEEASTADNVGDLVTTLLTEYNIDFGKVIGGVCDAGSNIKAFFDKSQRYHIHCLAHSIALIIKAAAKISTMVDVLSTVDRLAAHLSRSKADRKLFQTRSKMLQIKSRIPLPFSVTRWGASVMLAKAYLAHYESITCLPTFQTFLLSKDDKERLENYATVADPYLAAIHQAETDNSYTSEILVHYSSLFDFISSQNQHLQLVQILKEETKKRFFAYLENDVALVSCFVDPRFAYLPDVLFHKKWEEVETLVEEYCDSLRSSSNLHTTGSTEPPAKVLKTSNSVLHQFIESKRQSVSPGSTKSEIVSYEALLRSGRPPITSSPLTFWKVNSDRFPKLSQLARHMLSTPQSSAEVERLFSRCGQVVSSSRRNRLSVQTLNAMLLNTALANLKIKEENGSEHLSEGSEDEFDANEPVSAIESSSDAQDTPALPSTTSPEDTQQKEKENESGLDV